MSTATTIPRSGAGRRRAKAIVRRQRVHASENTRAVAAGGYPVPWSALDVCPCGRIAWLEEGASDQDRDDFYRESEDHSSYCDQGLG